MIIPNSLNGFTFGKKIGQGGFGEVLQATTTDGRRYAIKKIPHSKNQQLNITREANAGLKLSHKNIVNFVTRLQDDDNDYLVFDYVAGTLTPFATFAYLQMHKDLMFLPY